MLGLKQLKEHPLQNAAYRTDKKFIGLACGRGSGKSLIAKYRIVRALAETTNVANPIYFYLLPTEAQAKRVAWTDMLGMIPKEWIKKLNVQDKTIETHYGSTLYVLGGDKPARLEGVQWSGGVVDEACDYRPGVFDRSLIPALTHNCRFCYRIGVPKRFGPSSSEFRKWFFEDADDRFCASWPSSDIVEPSVLASMKRSLAPDDYDEQFNATWLSAKGGAYVEFDERFNIYGQIYYDSTRPIVVSSDFNVDPMSWVLMHQVGDYLIVFDEIRIKNTTTQRTLDELYRRYPFHKAGWIFTGDAASKQRSTNSDITDFLLINNDLRFENKSIMFPDSNPSILSRIQTVNASLRSADGKRHVYIHPKCKALIEDLKTQAFKANTMILDTTDKTIGHMADAFGYGVMLCRPIPVYVSGVTRIGVA